MIIDAHCDVLYQLWKNPEWSFEHSPELRINLERWLENDVKVQCFAIFVPDDVPADLQFHAALQMVDIFYDQVLKSHPNVKMVRSRQDIELLKENEKGAMLTLEGCHPIGHDIIKLKTLIHLGVKAVGLTWNNSNGVCDGIGEERGAGLSQFGREVIELFNTYEILTDVSHLSYQGFWDVMETAKYPIASHSNSYKLCSHKRNLDDKQLKALISKQAFVGVTFVPEFLTGHKNADTKDVMNHIEKIYRLGGENSVGLGSDFDGTAGFVKGLENYSKYNAFVQELKTRFSTEFVQKLTHQNFLNNLPT
ncbi:dipeptidase [Salinibacillus xinjiangensis]|uniref:Membrane dipeptidase n=1 Tax=Salinibacillus xinjiangensis TaxID=1229268 RepID=A0A6G1X2W1_9BACI|nr:dipeptidase [Salinibacillus xinjiangensis]MRG85327.1 membrane dipeptidase [Salinibacillus xinjiangensis]